MAYRRFHLLAGAALTLAACNMPNPAFGLDTGTGAGSGSAGTRGTSAGGTSLGATSGTSGTGTGTSSTGTSGTGTSGGASATAGTSAGSTGNSGTMGVATGAVDTGGTNMGDIPICPSPTPAGELNVLFAEGAQDPIPLPGAAVTIQGVLSEYAGGVWKLGRCQGLNDPCDPTCVNPDVFNAFVFDALPPGDWGPPPETGCYTATMHWNDDGSFQGGAIWRVEGMLLAPSWVARGVGPEPITFGSLDFAVQPGKAVDPCECEQPGYCVYDPPGEYKLEVSGSLVLDGSQKLATGDEDTGTLNGQTPVKMLDVISFVDNQCDTVYEEFTWIVKVLG